MKHLNKILTVVLIFTIVFTNVFIPNEKVLADEDSYFCLFCDDDKDDAKKEKQFAERIKIIKFIFGDSIDSSVLASTVLYLSFEEGIEQYYQEDFDSGAFMQQWSDIRGNIESNNDSNNSNSNITGINDEKMNLLISATVEMIFSNGFLGTYDEEKYKEALQKDNGFLEKNYSSVKGINDPDKKKIVKKNLADKIIEMAKMYNPWFNNEEDECVYNASSSLSAGEASNWRQAQNSPWSNLPLGTGGKTVAAAGCTSVSMAYLIKKSGTAVNVQDFTPGEFVKKVSYTSSCLIWGTIKNVAPNWVMKKQNVNISSYNAKTVAPVIAKELNTAIGNNNQPFVIIEMTGHWVAVDHVENGTVYVLDPASSKKGLITLDEALSTATTRHSSTAKLKHYNTFYAKDVSFGSSGTSSISSSLNYTDNTYKKRLDDLKNYYQCGDKLINVKLGKSNVCTSGCMVASLSAMYYTFTGIPTNVEELIKDMMKEGEWRDGQAGMGTPYFDKPTNSPILTKNWGFSGETLYSKDKIKIKEGIISNLKSGKKILLNLGGSKTTYSSVGGHFLMLDHYDESSKKIYIFNPAKSGTGYITESELMTEVLAYNKYGPWAISNSNANSINNYCGTDNAGTGTGNIKIPSEYGHGGYTVTFYRNSDNSWNWSQDSNQGKLYYKYWIKKNGGIYKNGIAVYEDRYLIACTKTFGKVGDKIDFFLEDGTRIPCIIADIKSSSDKGYNKWGHNNGQNVLEFEVSKSYFYNEGKGSNPGNGNWYPEWGKKRVASATNLGSIW